MSTSSWLFYCTSELYVCYWLLFDNSIQKCKYWWVWRITHLVIMRMEDFWSIIGPSYVWWYLSLIIWRKQRCNRQSTTDSTYLSFHMSEIKACAKLSLSSSRQRNGNPEKWCNHLIILLSFFYTLFAKSNLWIRRHYALPRGNLQDFMMMYMMLIY